MWQVAATQWGCCGEVDWFSDSCLARGIRGVFLDAPLNAQILLLFFAAQSFHLPPRLQIWIGAEAVWALVSRVVYHRRVNRRREPPQSTSTSKKELWLSCLAHLQGTTVKEWASDWNRGASFSDLKRGNIEDWLSWGLFGTRFRELDQEAHRLEVGNRVAELEAAVHAHDEQQGVVGPHFRFEQGHNEVGSR